jgi:Beta protein
MIKPLYAPLLRAKSGEFTALKNLNKLAKTKILPLFDIPRNTSKAKVPKTDTEHIQLVIAEICELWTGNPMMVDAVTWNPNAVTDTGEHIMGYIHAQLEDGGVHVNPVIGYDRWDNTAYQAALSNLTLKDGRHFVLRLDDEALVDSLDPEYFEDRIQTILQNIGRAANECVALIDFGDLSHKTVGDILQQAPAAIQLIYRIGFTRVIVAGSSIPETINLAVKTSSSEGSLLRKEMVIWQALFSTFPSLVFGDYGVRSPRSNENVIAPDTNGKIRYTIDKNFYIARGYSLRTKDKGAQHHALAAKIVASQHYLGSSFSWGDLQISKCANSEFSGNSTTWIGIDTNHHLEMVVSEVSEFMRKPEVVFRELV